MVRNPLIAPFSPIARRVDLSFDGARHSAVAEEEWRFIPFTYRLDRSWRGHEAGAEVPILSLQDWYEATGLIAVHPDDETRVTAAYPPE